MCVHTQNHSHTYMFAHTHASAHTHKTIHTHKPFTCTHICAHTHKTIHIHTCAHIHKTIQTHKIIHTHIYTTAEFILYWSTSVQGACPVVSLIHRDTPLEKVDFHFANRYQLCTVACLGVGLCAHLPFHLSTGGPI